MMSRLFRLSSELTGAIAKRLPHAKNQLSAPGSFFNQFVTDICIYIYKRASLACAARLADTSYPPEAPFGRLEVRLVNYKGDIMSKYVHLSYKIDITQKSRNLSISKFLMSNDDVIK